MHKQMPFLLTLRPFLQEFVITGKWQTFVFHLTVFNDKNE